MTPDNDKVNKADIPDGDDTETDVDSLPGAIGVEDGGGGGVRKTCRVKVFPPLGSLKRARGSRGGGGGIGKGKGKV